MEQPGFLRGLVTHWYFLRQVAYWDNEVIISVSIFGGIGSGDEMHSSVI